MRENEPTTRDHQLKEVPAAGFRALGISEVLCETLRMRSIHEPAPVQRHAIPVLLAGEDAIIESGTGTGKTLAYLLPMAERLDWTAKRLQGLIIVPTPELAMQIVRIAEELVGADRVAALIGGAALKRQIDKLKARPPLAVGTPGRLAELLRAGRLKTGFVRFAVIDEADQVFQPGAAEEAETVLAALPRDRQLAFVSATVTPEADAMAAKWMREPARPAGQSQEEAFAGVSHEYVLCDRRDKITFLRRFVRTVNPAAALVFVADAARIGEIIMKLSHAGIAAEPLYADAGKRERTAVMRRLSAGKLQLVIATDLAARGLDVPHLSHVIQFEPPADAGTYLHRAGRTGRMGAAGTVVTLAAPHEVGRLRKLAGRLKLSFRQMMLYRGEWVPVSSVPAPANARMANGGRRAGNARPSDKAAGSPAGGKRAGKRETGTAAAETSPGGERAANRQTDGATAGTIANAGGSPAGRRAARPAARPGNPPEPAAGRKPKSKSRLRTKKKQDKNKGAPRWLKEKQQRDSP